MNRFSRRNFSLGAAGALGSAALWPLLQKQSLAATPGATKVIFFYVPEGCAQQAFWPSSGPGAFTINPNASIDGKNPKSENRSIANYRSADMGTYCLQPLKQHESLLTLISGFDNLGRTLTQMHLGAVRAALTGSDGTNGGAGSIDQHLGEFLKEDSVFSSIFSSLYGEHVHDNQSGDFGSPIRTVNGGAGNPTWNPVTTYNQVFPSGIQLDPTKPPEKDHRLHARLRALGATKERLRQVKCAGGAEAQARIEAYLTSIERIEAETKALTDLDGAPVPEVDVTVDLPNGWTDTGGDKYWKNPANFGTLAKIQMDTAVAALALNRTRVSLMQFSASGDSKGIAGTHYAGLGIPGLEGATQDHHLGHDPNPVRRRDQARVFRWYYSQLQYLIESLQAVPDGEGTLMDSTLIVWCTEFSMYNHRATDMPYMLVGNPGGVFKKGVYLDASQNGNQRSHADFLLGLMRALGMSATSFGTSSNPYSGFLV